MAAANTARDVKASQALMCTRGSVPVPGEEGATGRWPEVAAAFGAALSTVCSEHRAPGAGVRGTPCLGSCSLWGPVGMKLVWVGRGSAGTTAPRKEVFSISCFE